MIGEKTIRVIAEKAEKDLKQELRDQGHYLTGALERSMEEVYKVGNNDVTAEVIALDYLDSLNEGIPASHIDELDPTYIAGLTKYAELRFGYKGKRALKAALAIARKHRKEGNPTRSSYQYSKTGERLEAIQFSYDEKGNDALVDQGLNEEMDELITNALKDISF